MTQRPATWMTPLRPVWQGRSAMFACCLLLLLNNDTASLLLFPAATPVSQLNLTLPAEGEDEEDLFAPTGSAPRLETSRRKAPPPAPALCLGLTFRQGC